MRLPVLIVETDEAGNISPISNQLHFIEESDIAPIVELASNKAGSMGILSNYALRYLRETQKVAHALPSSTYQWSRKYSKR
jgi:hypothetical protein